MQKVGIFRSIHVKFVLIYMMLILIAMQIIGFYFAQRARSNIKNKLYNIRLSIE